MRQLELSRRALLAGTAAGGLVAALPGIAEAAAVGAPIDIHAHALPHFYVDALRRAGLHRVSGLPTPKWSPRTAVAFMNRHGIGQQVLSVPDPAVSYLRTASARVALAERLNDYLHQITASRHSATRGRFRAFAVLPIASTSDANAALAEARRSLGLGLDGVSLLSNYGDAYLGDPGFAPLLGGLNELKAVVFVHGNVAGTHPARAGHAVVLEGPFNTTRTIVQLSYLQAFTLYPNITWIFGDGGGVLPYLAYRTSLLELYPAIAQNLGLNNLDNANFDYGKQHFDTAWASSPAALRSLTEVAGADSILFGSDWPLSAPSMPRRGFPQPTIARIFSSGERRAIRGGNALRLLGT
ncbi:MAG: amidohydrolase family protein [Nocardioides sp.]|uniref:amidohydrolase family protein n=1 Tax=Nocardioides sp. TaxID=35761 RepID=UPI0039E402A1